MNIEIKAFKASYGDSLLVTIEYIDKSINILIDCGLKSTYKNHIRSELKKIDAIDLLVLTHIDNDHINGAISLFRDKEILENIKIKNIWFNDLYSLLRKKNSSIKMKFRDYKTDSSKFESYGFDEEVGFDSAKELGKYIDLNNYTEVLNSKKNVIECNENLYEILYPINHDIKFVLLSPHYSRNEELLNRWSEYCDTDINIINDEIINTFYEHFGSHDRDVDDFDEECSSSYYDIEEMAKEDIVKSNIVNDASIAFFIEVENKRLLFLGDSNPLDINRSLRKYMSDYDIKELKFDLVKVSHHGSKYNTTNDFFDICCAKKYLISTNGRRFNHPDMECLSKILFKQKDFKTIVFNYYREDINSFLDDIQLKEEYKYEIEMPNDGDEYKTTVIKI